MRIGYGFDVHKFGTNNPLIICGVKIPNSKGLISHSNGDVAIHSIIDAILGASSLGDIGSLFPSSNKKLKNIDSRYLLRIIYNKITKLKFLVNNIDITIIAQKPKMSHLFSKMKKNIAQDLKICINCINIKATTTENLGFFGKKMGIGCSTIASLITNYKYINKKKY